MGSLADNLIRANQRRAKPYSFTDSVNTKEPFRVPGRANKLDCRLPTEQMAPLREKLRIIEMRLVKARRLGDVERVMTLSSVRERCVANIQRVGKEIADQWNRDAKRDVTLAANDKRSIECHPRGKRNQFI